MILKYTKTPARFARGFGFVFYFFLAIAALAFAAISAEVSP